MDINNRNMDVSVPSGFEVESATLHAPVVTVPMGTDHQLPAATDSGLRHKLDNLKSLGMAKMQSVQRVMSDRGASMKTMLSERSSSMKTMLEERSSTMKQSLSTQLAQAKTSMRSNLQMQKSNMDQSMRANPMMWAGIAGGTGMVLGLVGRFVHWRANRPMPDLVIIEAC